MEEPQPTEGACRRIELLNRKKNSALEDVSNVVRTTKYTLWTFLPLNLFEQFRRVANVYFLIISVLTSLPISSKDPVSLISTFALVLLISALKEAYEDYHRHISDEETNHLPVSSIRAFGSDFHTITWAQVQVGDVLELHQDELVPADCIVLATSDREYGVCHVETANLDGESNLKILEAPVTTRGCATVSEFPQGLTFTIEPPSADLYRFEGMLESQKQDAASLRIIDDDSEPKRTKSSVKLPLTTKQLLLRGCVIRNTAVVWAVVIYTGRDSRIQMNASATPLKVSKVMKTMNQCLYLVFGFQALLCALNTVVAVASLNAQDKTSQMGLPFEVETYLSFLVAYSNLIPISLYVGIEVMKLTQQYLINHDVQMYHTETDTPALSRTSNLVEELGQVQYVFSDKTGTLTCNRMEFLHCAIGDMVCDQSPDDVRSVEEIRCSPYASASSRFKDPRSFEILSSDTKHDIDTKKNIHHHFWSCLGLCHTVEPEAPKTPSSSDFEDLQAIQYQSTSPDEIALIKAARDMGYCFTRRQGEHIDMVTSGSTVAPFEVLHVFEFDSTRKRMSVVLRSRTNPASIILYCKGADLMILRRLSESSLASATCACSIQTLSQFSKAGLRTLCIAMKAIDLEQYGRWRQEYLDASVALSNRQEKMETLMDQLESGLELLGTTAIEDRLQDGVPETIANLKTAGIKIWVLTGDKEETAENIGYACRLLRSNMILHHLSRFTTTESLLAHLQDLVSKESQDNQQPTKSIKAEEGLILDGPALALALDPSVCLTFLRLATRCAVTICCRVSPKQKAEVVTLVKTHLDVTTLAIGDGGNDVSMIQAAHLGIGIRGEEGLQAVRSSDYAIAQFQYLERLVLVHGQWAHSRLSKFILYYFYKNMVLVLTEYWFAWASGFSGQIFFADWLALAFNAAFTSYPCVVGFALDQFLHDTSLLKFPQLYSSEKRTSFCTRAFLELVVVAVTHSAICYWFPIWTLEVMGGFGAGHWITSTASFTLVIFVVTARMLLHISSFNLPTKVVTGASIALYVFFLYMISLPNFAATFQPELHSMLTIQLSLVVVFLVFVLSVWTAMMPEVVQLYLRRTLDPLPQDIVAELQQRKSSGDYRVGLAVVHPHLSQTESEKFNTK